MPTCGRAASVGPPGSKVVRIGVSDHAGPGRQIQTDSPIQLRVRLWHNVRVPCGHPVAPPRPSRTVRKSDVNASLDERYDAIVVGARCAGAATAMLLARRGLKVLVFDRDRRGADTLSTLAIMRAGVLQLHRWGLLDEVRASGAQAIRSTSFVYGDEAITVPIKPRDGVDALYAPRRT